MSEKQQQQPRQQQAEATNQETVTCRYCRLPIAPGRGVYREQAGGRKQMGWLHTGACTWFQVTAWNEESEGSKR